MTSNGTVPTIRPLPSLNNKRERSISDEGMTPLATTSALTTTKITKTLNNISPFRNLLQNPIRRRSQSSEDFYSPKEDHNNNIHEEDEEEDIDSDEDILDGNNTVATTTTRGGGSGASVICTRPEFDLCAVMYKRRGGLGRNADNNWVIRAFTLKGSVLCYYNSPSVGKVDASKPRRRIDLSKEEVIAEMHNMHKPGAPSSHLVTVNIYVLGGKRKWEMCCMDKNQQEQWYHALKRFDNKKEDNFGHSAISSPMTRTHKGKTGDLISSAPVSVTQPQKMHRSRSTEHHFEKKSIYSHVPFLEYVLHSNYFTAFIAWNIAAYLIRFGSYYIYMIVLAVSNLALWQYLAKVRLKEQQLLSSSLSSSILTQHTVDGKIAEGATMLNSYVDTIASASSIKRATPIGATAEEIQNHGMDSAAAIQAYSNPNASYDPLPNSYWNVVSSLFYLRVGPNYKKLKNKEPSASAMYDLYGMDIINASSTLKHVEDCFELPEIPGVTDLNTGHKYIPPMLVIHVSIPMEEPSMLGGTHDGPCFVVVFYLVISQDTLKQIQNMNNTSENEVTTSPALKLFGEWCEKAETDDVFRGRFKAMCIIDDIEDLGLPSMVANANGKPVLINKSGSFTRHPSYIEMSINVFNFSYIAKKCLHMLFPKFVSMILNVGFTIEGRDDEELPEVLLGGAKVFNLDPDSVPAEQL